MSNVPIADHAIISDCHSAALVTRSGSVDWLCFPRFDGPATFARLLDDDAGHFSIRPVDEGQTSRRYVEQAMVLETMSRTATGELVVVDALVVGRNERGHDLGAASPHVLVRKVTCLAGEVEVDVEYAPRPEYGLVYPLLASIEGGIVARGGADVLVLSSPVSMEIDGSTARARFTLEHGQSAAFALHHRRSWEEPPSTLGQGEITTRLDDTIEAWRTWSDLHQGYDGPWRDLVHTSGRVLQALTFQPTGAICAAATTSLPEEAGGERNWDYRYAWVR
ncbi:MAG: glycoside hydrolase family 15 protein, partial [Actinobacteria bacterium]|nr:glycoside hydrolase family 15 protein [Actinomycetota bacterium]